MEVLAFNPDGYNIISPYNPILYTLIEDLLNDGIRVTLVSGMNKGQSEMLGIPSWLLRLGGLKIKMVRRIKVNKKNLAIRYLEELWFALCCSFEGIFHSKADIVFIPSTPAFGIAAVLLAKIGRKKVIYNLQDIFPDAEINCGVLKNPFIIKVFRIIEKQIYKSCSKLVVLDEDMQRNIISKGVCQEDVLIIPNWIDDQAVREVSRDRNSFFVKYSLSPDLFYVVHAGNLGLAQNMDIVLEAARQLTCEKGIRFLMIGDGSCRSRVVAKAKAMALSNMSFYPFEPQERVSEVYSAGNAYIVSLKRGVIGTAVPSKTNSIMACSRPVLACVDEGSGFYNMINDNGLGIAVGPEDVQGLADAILKLYKCSLTAGEMGEKSRKYIECNLSR
ncbi:MAG TPA: glycosyltransferase family 4 protein, partial [Ruminiclostridium sp.]|nr:glycosyltransferase family 4 protein [Ruminiclostridium sp.]